MPLPFTSSIMASGEVAFSFTEEHEAKAGRGIQMIVSDTVKLNKPSPTNDPSFYFFDEETGSLSRNDPYQPDLPLQTIPARRTLDELREVKR